MSIRIRIIYSKRNYACFVPHVALSAVFSRAALRAGLNLTMTQGFSPRAKISFCPELPAGVIGLNEIVEMFFNDLPKNLNLIDSLNRFLPNGFKVHEIFCIDENSPSLGKFCTSAMYYIKSGINLMNNFQEFYNNAVLEIKNNNDNEYFKAVLEAPSQNGIGIWVKNLISNKIIDGWQNINIVRAKIGNNLKLNS